MTIQPTTDTDKAALLYRQRGWPVFPIHWLGGDGCSCERADCEDVAKHPVADLVPHGFKDASIDEDCIRRWWTSYPEANIGVPTGPVSGIVAIDVDNPRAEDVLYAAAGWTNGEPVTLVHRTPRGGWHYIFRHPGEPVKTMPSAWIDGERILGLDWKGDGGYILVPPSVGAASKPYDGGARWYEVLQDAEPAPWPARLPTVPERPRQAPLRRTDHAGPAPSGYLRSVLEGELQAVMSAVEGTRNDQLNRSAHAAFRFSDLRTLEVEEAFVSAAIQAGLPDFEARGTVRSALRARA